MIEKFEYFIALARERHFGRAAESCGVTQQTLSAGIKHLEERLGLRLVNRGARFQGLTPEGERVLAHARRVVAEARALDQEVASLKRGLSGHLTLAAIPTALPMIAALTAPFLAHHPAVRFTVLSRTSAETLAALADARADAGLTYLDSEPVGDVTAIPIYRERYRLLAAAAGPFGARGRVTWAEAGRAPLCLLTPDMQNRRLVDQHLRAAGAEPSPMLETNSIVVLVAHVRAGAFASIVPAALADALGPSDGVRSIPIVEPDVTHTIGLVAPHAAPAPPLVAALCAEARALARRLDPDLSTDP
jgi:DNA-binding transcriptional LysR family regulator